MNENTKSLIEAAIAAGSDPHTISLLLDADRDQQYETAKKAFFDDFAKVQAELPIIGKSKGGQSGHQVFKYVPLEGVVEKAIEIITKRGFSWSADSVQSDSQVLKSDALIVSVTLHHKCGHSITSNTVMPISPDKEMAKFIGKLTTYGRRYCLMSVLGVAVKDEDDETSMYAGSNGGNRPNRSGNQGGYNGQNQGNGDNGGPPASAKQQAFISRLCHDSGRSVQDVAGKPVEQLTVGEAKGIIDKLKNPPSHTDQHIAPVDQNGYPQL